MVAILQLFCGKRVSQCNSDRTSASDMIKARFWDTTRARVCPMNTAETAKARLETDVPDE